MQKLTLIQKITVICIILYVIWEIAVRIWMTTLPPDDPVIRADLVLILPVLIILIVVSLIQFIIRKIKNN